MLEKVKLGLVGRGPWGQNYLKTIRGLGMNLPDECVVGRNYQDLLFDESVAGVIIACTSGSHFQVARDCINAGANVLVEKPLTQSYAEALALQKVHDGHEVVVGMVGHIQVYDEVFGALKQSLERVGRVVGMNFAGQKGIVREGSDVLTDWGPHPTYLFIDLAGSPPSAVSAKSEGKHDISLRYSFGDIEATAHINLISQVKTRSLTVSGTEGQLRFDWGGPSKTLTFTNLDGEREVLTPNESQSPLAREVLEFVRCIESGDEPSTPLSQGVAVMGILEAFKTSLATGNSIQAMAC